MSNKIRIKKIDLKKILEENGSYLFKTHKDSQILHTEFLNTYLNLKVLEDTSKNVEERLLKIIRGAGRGNRDSEIIEDIDGYDKEFVMMYHWTCFDWYLFQYTRNIKWKPKKICEGCGKEWNNLGSHQKSCKEFKALRED